MSSTQVAVNTVGLSRDEWLTERRRGIGGSDIPAILGLTPTYRTAIDVWMEKTGRREPSQVGEAADWGIRLEPVVAQHFAEITGYKINRRNAILQHRDYPWMLANLDREVLVPGDGRGVLEIKTTSAFLSDLWTDDKVPLAYQAQVQWYLAVTGYPFGYIAVLIGGQRFLKSRIDRDEEVIASLIAAGEGFWQCVLNDSMPEVDGSEACADVLSELYPRATPGKEIAATDLPPTVLPLVEEYDTIKAQITELDSRKTFIENSIKQTMGDAECAWAGDRPISWTTVISRRVNSKRLKAEHPDVYEAVAEESSSRRFEIKKAKA
jgi:putative phage-type endonuclease